MVSGVSGDQKTIDSGVIAKMADDRAEMSEFIEKMGLRTEARL
jgi:hypothetical protein